MKKIVSIALVLALLLVAVSCGKEKAPEVVEDPVLHVTFWFDNGSTSLDWLNKTTADFNALHAGEIEVESIYVGSIRTKFLTSALEDRPNLIICTGNQSPLVISSTDENGDRLIIPMQDFIDRDKWDESVLHEPMKLVWQRDGRWQGLPYGCASVGHMFNQDILDKIGVSAYDINSYEEIFETLMKLKEAGLPCKFYPYCHSDFYCFPLTAEGIQYFNNNNGWDAEPTDSTIMTDPVCYQATLDFFKFYQNLAENDLLIPVETATGTAESMFANGEIAIMEQFGEYFTRCANKYGNTINFIYREMCTIHKGVPSVGQATGGRAIFLANVHNEKVQDATWEFVKYLMQGEVNAGYALTVGLFPVGSDGVTSQVWQDYVTKYPTLIKPMEAIEATGPNVGYAVTNAMQDWQSTIKTYIQKVCNLKLTAEEAVPLFAAETKECCEMYLLSQGIIV